MISVAIANLRPELGQNIGQIQTFLMNAAPLLHVLYHDSEALPTEVECRGNVAHLTYARIRN